MNGLKDKIKSFIAPEEDDYEYDYEDDYNNEDVALSGYENAKAEKVSKLGNDAKMVLFEPRSFEEVDVVGKRIKENRAVVVNLHKLTRENAQRTIDFLSGVTMALEGSIQKVGKNVILCAPKTMGVHGSIESDKGEE